MLGYLWGLLVVCFLLGCLQGLVVGRFFGLLALCFVGLFGLLGMVALLY